MYRLREELTSVTADLEESQREKIKKVTSLQSSVRTLKSELESREISMKLSKKKDREGRK